MSFFPAFLSKRKDAATLKEELLEAISPLDRGAEATPEDQQRVDQVGVDFALWRSSAFSFFFWLRYNSAPETVLGFNQVAMVSC